MERESRENKKFNIIYISNKDYKENKTKNNKFVSKIFLISIITLIIYFRFFEEEQFNDSIKNKFLLQQLNFCENQISNILIENSIELAKVNLYNISYDMYVYKTKDFVSKTISGKGFYEINETRHIISSLEYYSNRMNISKNNIYILDIGANIGWYSLMLGKIGYNVLSFEPSNWNYYILRKNYCLNKNTNMIFINKGLDTEEKNCDLYHPLNNIGNGFTFCNSQKFEGDKTKFRHEKMKLTKLKNYIPFLKSKNLALIKLDIEGAEGKAIESGIDLVIKYHIPFIFLEFTPKQLIIKGTDPKLFLEMFENNGYKISKMDFLSKNYCSSKELITERKINIYIIYTQILE